MLRLTLLGLLCLAALAACAVPNAPGSTGDTSRPIPTLPRDTPALPTATPTRVVLTPFVNPTLPPTTPTPAPAKLNPFGLMVGPDALGIEKRLALVKNLGGTYFRPWDVAADRWDGTCAECGALSGSGLKVLLTVRAGGSASGPSAPPRDLNQFKRTLGYILDMRRPELLVVENEESSAQLFYSGTPPEYAIEERAACDVAHSRGIRCTNGGLASDLVVLLVWANYADTNRTAQGCLFARRALEASQAQVMCNARTAAQLPKQLQDDLARGRALLKLYASTGADFLNFHWYVSDAGALDEAVAYLRTASGMNLISNEMGQQSDNADMLQPLLQKALDLGLPYVIWYSVDAPRARALNNPDGSLRPTGEAFKSFVKARFN